MNKSAEFVASCPLREGYIESWCTFSPSLHLISLCLRQFTKTHVVEKRKRNREIAQMSNEKETKGEQRKSKKTLIFHLLSFWKGLLDKLKAVMYSRLV